MTSVEEWNQEIEQRADREYSSYFKHCSDSDDVLKGIFEDQKIRFTQPRALNDPLEFNPIMHFHNSNAVHHRYELEGIELPSKEMFYRVQMIESQVNRFGILSLTKVPDSFDLWTQYANGHRGFVIEFQPDFASRPCMRSGTGSEYPVRKVEYVDDYAINLDDLVDDHHEIPLEVLHNELFFKKTSRWKHEEEYRMIRPLADCPDYQPPKNNYPSTDTITYLFDFTWDCISSIIMGTNMSSDKKRIVARSCEKHGISLFQSCIIKDHKDRAGTPSTVLPLALDNYDSKEMLLGAKPQLLCTDLVRLSNLSRTVKINRLSDLPYYRGYEDVLEEMHRSLKADRPL